MLEKLELSNDCYIRLKNYCDKINIEFIATPFDIESVKLLEFINIKTFKVGSGDITNFQLLKKIANINNSKIILSTGMSDISEIKNAVSFIRKNNCNNIVILHCVSSYPVKIEELNMKSITTIKNTFENIDVGFSDHTLGSQSAIIAISLGATYIEKHFTIDCNLDGPDHKASLNPKQLKDYINTIRTTEVILGDSNKRCMDSEIETRKLVRRSIAINKDLKKTV